MFIQLKSQFVARILGAAALGGWVISCGGSTGGGSLSASWKGSGKSTGTLATGATANWCAAGHLLEIMAISGDSAIALLLYPAEGVKPGSFAVIDALHQPVRTGSAAIAARWPDQEQILGYRGVSGSATLKVEGEILSGSVTSTMIRPGATPDTLAMTATFVALKADSGVAACPPDSGGHKRADSMAPPVPQDSAR